MGSHERAGVARDDLLRDGGVRGDHQLRDDSHHRYLALRQHVSRHAVAARLEPKLRGRELHGAPRRSRRVTPPGERGEDGEVVTDPSRLGRVVQVVRFRGRRNAVQDGLRLVVVELMVRPDHRPTEPRAVRAFRSIRPHPSHGPTMRIQRPHAGHREPFASSEQRADVFGKKRGEHVASAAVGEVHGGAARVRLQVEERSGLHEVRHVGDVHAHLVANLLVVFVHVGVHVGARVQSDLPNGQRVVDVDAPRRVDAHRPYPTHVHPRRQLRIWYAPRGLFIVSIRTR